MAANSTSKFCRRLFQDSAPKAAVQQTMERIVRADQERFAAKWNFDVTQTPSAPVNSIADSKPAPLSWQVVNPKASFYLAQPRRLKARRRLTPSVAEKLCQEIYAPQNTLMNFTSSNFLNFDFNLKFKKLRFGSEQSFTGFTGFSLPIGTVPVDIHVPKTAACTCAPFSKNSPMLSEILPCNPSTSDAEPVFKLPSPVASRKTKRKSVAKMTDYFVVYKRSKEGKK